MGKLKSTYVLNVLFLRRLPLFILLLLTAQSYAATKNWLGTDGTGNTGGVWGTGSNWSGGSAPATGDDIVFTSNAAISITGVPSLVIRTLTLSGGGTVTLQSTSGTVNLDINGPEDGTNLSIAAGTTLLLTTGSGTMNLRFATTENQKGQINGTLQVNTNGVFNSSNVASTIVTVSNTGTIVNNRTLATGFVTSAPTLQFASGANYNHIITGTSTIPTATWNVNSTVTITSGTSTVSGFGQTFGHVTINSAGTITMSGSPVIAGTLTLTAGTFAIAGNALTLKGSLSGSGTMSSTASSELTISENSPGNASAFTIPSSITVLNKLTLDRVNGASVDAATLTLSGNPALTLLNGKLSTSISKLLIVSNNASGTIVVNTGGTSFVNGPMRRSHQFVNGNTYLFPVGKSGYNPLEVTTTTTLTNQLTAEVFDASQSGASAGTGMGGSLYPRSWVLTANTSIANGLINPVTLYDQENVCGTTVIGWSSASNGTYNSIGGTNIFDAKVSSSTANPFTGVSTVYLNMNVSPTLAPGTYTLPGTVSSTPINNLTELAAFLNGRVINGGTAVFEFQSPYTGAEPAYPVVFNYFGGTGNVVVRPHSSVSGSLITAGNPGNNNPLINFISTKKLGFDGRPGGSGSSINWIFRNTMTANVGPTIQFQSGASNNCLKYLQVEGQNTGAQSGVILLDANATTPRRTNNADTVAYCLITNNTASGSPCTNAIAAFGNGTSPATFNNNMVVMNNNVSNFNSGTSSGVIVSGTNTNTAGYGEGWKITGNSFFSSIADPGSGQTRAVNFNSSPTGSASTGNIITDNFIGGTASALPGGSITGVWKTTANVSSNPSYIGIFVAANSAVISGNTIGGLFNSNTSGTGFFGIQVDAGSSSGAFTISNNTIGSTKGPGNTYFGTSASSVAIAGTGSKTWVTQPGMSWQTGDRVRIASSQTTDTYNEGTVATYNSGSGSLQVTVDLVVGSGTPTAWNITLAEGIQCSGQSPMQAIRVTFGTNGTSNITGNTIGNMTHINQIGQTTALVSGITTTNGRNTITGNTIYNLAGNTAKTSTSASNNLIGSVVGIAQASTAASQQQVVSNNTIFNLYSNFALTGSPSATANHITGIELSGVLNAGITHICDGNLVHSLSSADGSNGVRIFGIYSNSGQWQLTNNMIRLGIRSSGTSITGSAQINGIFDGQSGSSTGIHQYYHNSVYIGGSAVVSGSAIHTYAFRRANSGGTKNKVDVRNNIFVNQRSNASGTGLHFCIGYDSNGNLGSGLSFEDYNDCYGTGTGFLLGQVGITDCSTYALLRTNTGNSTFDLNSLSADPLFIDATSGAPNLRIDNPASPADEVTGATALIAHDIDGLNRANYTPVDLGAAVVGASSCPDPAITLGTMPSTYFSAAAQDVNLSYSGPVNDPVTYSISDWSGGSFSNVTDATLPASPILIAVPAGTAANVYTAKLTVKNACNSVSEEYDIEVTILTPPITAAFSADNTSICSGETVSFTDESTGGVTSWTWTVTPNGGGSYTFVNSTTANSQHPDIEFSGSGTFTIELEASDGVNDDTETKTAYIGLALSGTFTIGGTTPDYASFGDAVNALNTMGVCGPVIFDVRSGTYTEAVTIGQVTGSSSVNTITFRPEAGATVTLTSSNATATVIFNGADYVIFEGRQGGTGSPHAFTITNSNTFGGTGNAIRFVNDATRDTVRYCVLNGPFTANSPAGGLVEIGGTTGSTGNDYLTIDNNKIGNVASSVTHAIYSNGNASFPNDHITITNNELFNFAASSGFNGYGIRVTNTGNGGNWTISGNSIYQSITNSSSSQYGIFFEPGTSSNNNVISENFIGGSAASCGGSAWPNTSGGFLAGIRIAAGTGDGTLIENNVIQNISTDGEFTGINVASGKTMIIENLVGHTSTANSIFSSGGDAGFNAVITGIRAVTNSETLIEGNTIQHITANSGFNSFYGITNTGNGGVSIITGNTIKDCVGNGTANVSFMYGINQDIDNISGNRIDSNEVSIGNNSNSNVITPVSGIRVNGSNSGGTVSYNRIINIFQRQPGQLYGMEMEGTGSYGVYNNVVHSTNSGYTKATFVYGIWDGVSSGTVNYYNNTVLLAGATIDNSFAFVRTSNTSQTVNLANNIFVNANPSGSGFHYAIYNATSSGWNSDHNFLATVHTGRVGFWVSGSALNFGDWQTASSDDGSSTTAAVVTGSSSPTEVNMDELFVDPDNGDLHIAGTYPAYLFVSDNGSITLVSNEDIDGETRCPDASCPGNASLPDRGADEFVGCPPPVITASPTDLTSCPGNVSFEVTATNATGYQWEWRENDSSTWTEIDGTESNPSYTDYATGELNVNGISFANDGYQYRVVVSNACGSIVSDTATLTALGPGHWTALVDDKWETPGNWCGGLPGSGTNVVIPTNPAGGDIFPHVETSGTALANSLFLMPGTSVTVETGSDLGIYGNITNFGEASWGTGTVKLLGSLLQTIGGSTESEFGELELNNTPTPTGLQLLQNLVVIGTLNMLNANGNIDLNGFSIDLGTTGTIANESNNNRILGAGEVRAVRTLSAASTPYNNIAGLGVSITTGAVNLPGETEIVRTHSPYTVLSNTGISRSFRIEPEENAALNATLRINYFDAELSSGTHDKARLIPWRSTDNGATWEGQFFPARLSNHTTQNWVQLTQIPAFSIWTLSDWENEPLPIELLSFTAINNGNRVDLEWTTIAEINNDFFTVERSTDAVHFSPILTRPGAGNSTQLITYTDADPDPLPGTSYYRLRQTDFNGSYNHSDIVVVQRDALPVNVLHAWVNPERNINVQITGNRQTVVSLQLFDATGKLITGSKETVNKGINSYTVYKGSLAPGIYLLRASDENGLYTQKLFVR